MENTKFRYMSIGDKTFTVANYVVLTAIFLIVLYPIIYVVSASFSSPQAVISGRVLLLPVEPTLRGYEAVFQNAKILSGFANSIFYLVAGTAINKSRPNSLILCLSLSSIFSLNSFENIYPPVSKSL